MNPIAKMVIGILVFLAGIVWYGEGIIFGTHGIANALHQASNFQAFLTLFSGMFGVILIMLGAVIAWIEFEDIKWERKEKKKK